jgi:glycosyltransferase involved in cell wall biosynthesis
MGAGRIRVAHVMHGLMMGGLEQVVVRLCDAGRRIGVEPMVVAFGADGAVRELLDQHSIRLAYLGAVRGMSPQAIQNIARALREHRVDVAHAHDMGPWLNAVASRALAPRVRTTVTFHQIATPAGFERGAAIAAALMSDALVACGDEVHACVRRWAPPGTRIELIPNGIPIGPEPTAEDRARARARMGLPDDARVLGYVGRLHEEKGVDLLVDAFLASFDAREDVHLVIVGKDGREGRPFEAGLRARADRAGCRRIHFLGEIVEASSLLAGLDVYVQPSRREGRSLAMLEAMAAGLPTVAQGLPAMREIHVHGATALLVPPGPHPPFGPAMLQLLELDELRARMGRNAREHVRRHSVDAMAGAYAELYEDILDGKRRVGT